MPRAVSARFLAAPEGFSGNAHSSPRDVVHAYDDHTLNPELHNFVVCHLHAHPCTRRLKTPFANLVASQFCGAFMKRETTTEGREFKLKLKVWAYCSKFGSCMTKGRCMWIIERDQRTQPNHVCPCRGANTRTKTVIATKSVVQNVSWNTSS